MVNPIWFCVRTVSHAPQTPGQHGDLRADADAHQCGVKLLIASALVGFRVRQHAWRESISKRARSTTPPSLRFRINGLRAADNDYRRHCDKAPNVLRSRPSVILLHGWPYDIHSQPSDRPRRIRCSGHRSRSASMRRTIEPGRAAPLPLQHSEAGGGDRHPSRPKKSSTAGVDCVLHDVSLHLRASGE